MLDLNDLYRVDQIIKHNRLMQVENTCNTLYAESV